MHGDGEPSALPGSKSIRERIAFAILATVATLMAFNGLSMLAAAVPLLAYPAANARVAAIAYAAIRLALAIGVTGVVARHLTWSRKPLLPNERELRPRAGPLGGWILVLIAALWLLPLTAFYELAPLRALSRDMLDVLRENHVWEDVMRAPHLSGFVVLPVVATFVVPLFELMTAVAFAGSSALLLLLLWDRSFRFPRAYLICLLLQAGLLFASIYGTEVATGVAQWVADLAGSSATQTRTIEDVRVLQAVERYNGVLSSTSHSLAWTFLGYALWMVPLLLSRRARETFALTTAALRPAADAPAPSAVAGLPRDERRRFYENAARTLQMPATSGAAVGSRFAIVFVFAVMGALFFAFAVLRVVSQAGALRPQ